jgi:hypothetical protein
MQDPNDSDRVPFRHVKNEELVEFFPVCKQTARSLYSLACSLSWESSCEPANTAIKELVIVPSESNGFLRTTTSLVTSPVPYLPVTYQIRR